MTMKPSGLLRWRKARNMTQKQAAVFVGISERHWRRYETGKYPIPRWLERSFPRFKDISA